MNISNILTLLRIAVIPIIVICIYMKEPYFGWIAFFLFCLASITDYFDGYIARLRNEITNFGTFLDPIADKILIVFVFFGLSVNLTSYFIAFVASLIITREIWVGALRDLNARNSKSDATKVTFLAKIKTTIQLFTISIYLIALTINNMLLIIVADILLFISLFITLYTGLLYTINTFKNNNS